MTDDEGKPSSTGSVQAETIYQKIQEWNVVERIAALVFDTTASNTGKHKGASVRVQKLLKALVFYLGCRQHISEL